MSLERSDRVMNEKRQKKRKWLPRPLVLPADQVTYEPPDDLPEEVREYLFAYARTGSRTGACRLSGHSLRQAYKWAEIYGDRLTEEENRALENITERILDTARTQALEDPDMPGTTMRIFMLKAAYPEYFAERQKLEHSGKIETTWLDVLADRAETDSTS